MKAVVGALAGLTLTAASLSSAAAEAKAITPTVGVTFRLQVSGTPAAGSTFWVAYGPLAGRFGIVQLRSHGAGLYTATRSLPATGRTTFAYLMGQGTVHTRAGLAPGNPVVTIRSTGPVTATALSRTKVQWSAPVG